MRDSPNAIFLRGMDYKKDPTGYKCNGLYVKKNRTSSMPKSVLCYVLDKGQYFDPETYFAQSCYPNK